MGSFLFLSESGRYRPLRSGMGHSNMNGNVKTVAIVQARKGANHLPGQVLQPMGGVPMICCVVRREAKSQVVVPEVAFDFVNPANWSLE